MHGRDEDSQVIRIRTGNIGSTAPEHTRDTPWSEIGVARREAGLSVEQVALEARVSPLVVEAIESGAVERILIGDGGRRETVAVCRVLELDPLPYLQDLRVRRPAVSGQLDTPRTTVGRRTRFLIIGLVWIALGALLVVGRSLGWMGSDDSPAPRTSAPASVSSAVPTSTPPNPAVAFSVEVHATRGGSPVRATVQGTVTYDEILRLDEEVRFEGDWIQLRIVQPTMVRVFVNGTPVAAETDMAFGTAPTDTSEEAPEQAPAEAGDAPADTPADDVSRP